MSGSRNGKPHVVATFEYDDGEGNQIARVDRIEPGRNGKRKEFFPYLRDGDGWAKRSGLHGRTLPLYRRGEVLEAARNGEKIFGTEGEGKADVLRAALRAAGISAAVTTIAGGADAKLLDEHVADFAGAPMVIALPDADASGRKAANQRAYRIARAHPTIDVRVVELFPGADNKRDVADWLREGHVVAELLTLADVAPRVGPDNDREVVARLISMPPLECNRALKAAAKELGVNTQALAGEVKRTQREMRAAARAAGNEERERGDERPPSIATKIVTLVLEAAELLRDGDETCASVIVNGHQETHRISSTSFRRYAVRAYYEKFGAAPNGTALAEALATLDAMARFDGRPCTIATRCAERDGKLYLDLTNDDWTAVEIGANKWEVVPAADLPVRFVRAKAAQPLPPPDSAGRLDELDAFLSGDYRDRMRVKGFLLNALRARTPQPVLVVIGPEGSGKTTSARICKRVLDPAKPETRGAPHEARDVTAAARNAHMLVFDNLSKIEPELSDIFCRLSTGSGFGGRLYYTNDDEAAFDAIRPVVLTAIDDVVVRGDLADRALTIRPPERDDELAGYKTEDAFFEAFELARPRILGGLLNAASAALARLPVVRAAVEAGRIKLPRMADFALFVTAAEPALGLDDGAFIRLMREERAAASGAILESAAIYPYLCAVIAEQPFTGFPADLLKAINTRAGDDPVRRDRHWPHSAQALTNQLKRLERDLRRAEIYVTRPEADSHSRRRPIIIRSRPSPDYPDNKGPAQSQQCQQSQQSPHFERETPPPAPRESPQNGPKSQQSGCKSPQRLPLSEHETGPFAETAETAETFEPVFQDVARSSEDEPSLFADPVTGGGAEDEPAVEQGEWT